MKDIVVVTLAILGFFGVCFGINSLPDDIGLVIAYIWFSFVFLGFVYCMGSIITKL